MRLCLESAPFGTSISERNEKIRDGVLASVPQDNLEMVRDLYLEGFKSIRKGTRTDS